MGSCSVSDLRAPEPHGLAVCVLVPGISLSGVAVAFLVTITKNLPEAPRGGKSCSGSQVRRDSPLWERRHGG